MSLAEARAAASLFEPQRLRLARQLRKQSRAALAGELEVSNTAVWQWEQGDVRPKAQTLLDISHALGFPVNFFASTGSPLASPDINCAFFRSLRKSRQVDREAAMAHAGLVAELLRIIERYAKLPAFDIPQQPIELDAPEKDIDGVAQQVRRQWGLEDEPVGNMVRELERHGTVVVRLRLANDVDAFSWPQPERPIIILGTDKEKRDRSRFDAAHELGHLVMHSSHPEPANKSLEKQAHRFAGAFLLPADKLISEWPSGRLNWSALLRLKQRWQTSLGAILYRGRNLDLLTETSYQSAVKYMSRAGWRTTEPGDLGPPERPRLLRRAVEALEQAGMTLHDLADEANVRLEDLRDYIATPGTQARVEINL